MLKTDLQLEEIEQNIWIRWLQKSAACLLVM